MPSRRPSPGLIIAVLALVAATAGTTYAALEIPRNSVGTKQLRKNAVVSSKVRNGSLKLGDFAAGQLPAGATGATGPAGPSTTTVPSGQTLRGSYSVNFIATAAAQQAVDSISFGMRMPGNMTARYQAVGEAPTAQCPGSAVNPAAAAGVLCLYESARNNVAAGDQCVFDTVVFAACDTASRDGASIGTQGSGGAGVSFIRGTWAATAP